MTIEKSLSNIRKQLQERQELDLVAMEDDLRADGADNNDIAAMLEDFKCRSDASIEHALKDIRAWIERDGKPLH
jgi:hypothetical protein